MNRSIISLATFISLVLSSTALPPTVCWAQKYDPQHPAVQEMVKRGVDYLSKSRLGESGESPAEGVLILAALAIYKADQEANSNHPVVVAGVRQAAEVAHAVSRSNYRWDHKDMYVVPLAAMLLTSYDVDKYGENIKQIRDFLLRAQRPNGGFGYMIDSIYKARQSGDISQTQYVMLCFWTMHQANIEVPQEAVVRCFSFLASSQGPDGGWPYQFPNPNVAVGQVATADPSSNSLAAAGLSGYLIAGDILGLFRSKWAENQEDEGIVPTAFMRVDPDEKKKKTINVDRAQVANIITRGEGYFRANPYNRAMWHYYYVYSKERYESFLEITKGKIQKSPDWYNKGVEELKAAQSPTGAWGAKDGDTDGALAPDICTSFAILFLVRSTQKAIGELHEDVLMGGNTLPDDPSAVKIVGGKMINKSATTNIDDALKMLESDGKSDGKASLIPDQLVLPKDPKERKEQLNRFARLMSSNDADARRFAAKLLGRGDDLDFVPALIYGLSDPDAYVPKYSEASLRLISRQLDTYHLPREGKATNEQRVQAVLQWRKWYLTVRPDYVFVE